jgi:hypothetical protein
VLFAGLYWSANLTAGSNGAAAPVPANKGQVKLKVTIGLPQVEKHQRPVTVVGVGKPAHGIAELDANGKVTYTPAKGSPAGTRSPTPPRTSTGTSPPRP